MSHSKNVYIPGSNHLLQLMICCWRDCMHSLTVDTSVTVVSLSAAYSRLFYLAVYVRLAVERSPTSFLVVKCARRRLCVLTSATVHLTC